MSHQPYRPENGAAPHIHNISNDNQIHLQASTSTEFPTRQEALKEALSHVNPAWLCQLLQDADKARIIFQALESTNFMEVQSFLSPSHDEAFRRMYPVSTFVSKSPTQLYPSFLTAYSLGGAVAFLCG